MELIRGVKNIRAKHQGCAITIGNFDGVHLGHQYLLQQLKERSKLKQLSTMLITFEPYPNEFFNPQQAAVRLTNLREKISLLKTCGIDYVLCLSFNKNLALITAMDFIQNLLVKKLALQEIWIGTDFHFGCQRQGDYHLLQEQGKIHGFSVFPMNILEQHHEKISSTRIRAALTRGDLKETACLLGRNYSICGKVVAGNKLGRTLGFPTANIALKRQHAALQGIFAVKVLGIKATPLSGVASLGTRPAIGGEQEILEVHLFDFQQNIYGKIIEVIFVEKLRDEAYFDTLNALQQQMEKDAALARQILKNS